MKIDFSAVIKDLDGDAVKDGDKAPPWAAWPARRCWRAMPTSRASRPRTKVKRFRLAEVASKGGQQELAVEDVALLKQLIGKCFAPLVVGRAYDIIEPPSA